MGVLQRPAQLYLLLLHGAEAELHRPLQYAHRSLLAG